MIPAAPVTSPVNTLTFPRTHSARKFLQQGKKCYPFFENTQSTEARIIIKKVKYIYI